MDKRIGVFFCRCSNLISDRLDEERVLAKARQIDGVVHVASHNLLCSPEGKKFLAEEIKEHSLDAVVVAACSPKLHEKTFMTILEETGVNPFMLQMANIREQCVWITPDKAEATEKATAYILAAINRVGRHESLETKAIECNPDILVVGSGVAGIEAAKNFSMAGRKVYLVEKEPCIGGVVARIEEVYPSMECAPCMIAPMQQEILQDPNVEVLTYSEIEEVKGFLGNFNVKILKKPKSIDEINCLGCGECYPVCPVEVKNKFDGGLANRHAIYVPYAGALPNIPVIDRDICLRFDGQDCSKCADACPMAAVVFSQESETIEVNVGGIVIATGGETYDISKVEELNFGKIPGIYNTIQMERLIASNGPTEGEIVMENGDAPKKIAIIHCAGSRNAKHLPYCSGICCLNNMKLVRNIKHAIPDAELHLYYRDFCLPGKAGQAFADETLKKAIAHRYCGKIKTSDSDGKIAIHANDTSDKFDMVVLTPGIVPSADGKKIAELFDLELDDYGFFKEDHNLLNISSSSMEGIQIAGAAQAPKGIDEAIAQAAGTAGKLLAKLVPGRLLEIETKVTVIDEELCGGCKMCISLCPYSAIDFDLEEKISRVNEVLCKGCGTCAAACPSGAAVAKHFTKEQVYAEIEEVTL